VKGPIDLHLHSTASDGDNRPAEVVKLASDAGLSAIALTDHDTLSGVAEFIEAANAMNIEAVAGVEIGVKDEPARGLKEVHMLCYFVEAGEHPLGHILDKLAAAKLAWAQREVDLLESKGFRVPFDECRACSAGSPTVRRPHIWKVFQRHNPGAMEADQFFRATDFGGPLYAPKDFQVTLEDVVRFIKESGGVAVLAHPAFYGDWPSGALDVLELASAAGVDGVETRYSYDFVSSRRPGFPTAAEVERVLDVEAERLGLVRTGGSDYHGEITKSIRLGSVDVPYSYLEKLKERRP